MSNKKMVNSLVFLKWAYLSLNLKRLARYHHQQWWMVIHRVLDRKIDKVTPRGVTLSMKKLSHFYL